MPRSLRAGRQGACAPTATGVRFTSGPLARREHRVADVHTGAIAMPSVRRRAARYQLVLRPAGQTHGPRWYCQDVS